MRTIYFLTPDHDCARAIVDDLRASGVEEKHISVLAKRQEPLDDLPEPAASEKSDLIPALQRGAGIGGAIGLFAGLASVAFPPAGIVLGGGAVLLTTAGGAALGAWMSSLIGISVPNTQLEKFEAAIERGEILMLVEVDGQRVEEIKTLVEKHHPGAEFEGVEPKVKVMPQTE